jgi:hypothetical protein
MTALTPWFTADVKPTYKPAERSEFDKSLVVWRQACLDASNIHNFFGAAYRTRLDAAFEHVKRAYEEACKADDAGRGLSADPSSKGGEK